MGNGIPNSKESYPVDCTPKEAWRILEENKDAILVDVRTTAEWSFVGVPDLSSLGREVVMLSWRLYPQMQINEKFLEQLVGFGVQDKNAPVLFICRVGGRSGEAARAAAQAGYAYCYNVLEGFEGDVNEKGHRGVKGGWKAAALPWTQN